MNSNNNNYKNHTLLIIVSKLLITIFLVVSLFKDSHCASVATSRKPKGEHGGGGGGGQNCTNHLNVIDRCSSLSTYSYTSNLNPYPINANEFKASCDRIQEGLKCLRAHGKCMSSVSRRALTTFASARSRHSKRMCANLGSDQSNGRVGEFIEAANCVVKSNKRNQMIAHERDLINSIQYLAANSSMKWDDRFHGACCVATAYKLKVLKDIEPECSKFKQSQEDMVNSMIGELLDSACPEGDRLRDICNKTPKLNLSKEWKTVSLTGAALDLIVALSDNPKE